MCFNTIARVTPFVAKAPEISLDVLEKMTF